MTSPVIDTDPQNSLTHLGSSFITDAEQLTACCDAVKARLKLQADTLHLPLAQTLDLVDQLAKFDLGRFLLVNQSLNGYWTHYVFKHIYTTSEHPLEHWLLNHSLLTQAQERLQRFKVLLQQALTRECTLASIPCGLMADLLELDYRSCTNYHLTGIDLDLESLEHAQKLALNLHQAEYCTFEQADAWQISQTSVFDIISSNGLNMYEPDPQRLIALYQRFYTALKPGGRLLISFLPPPPDGSDPNYTWDNFNISNDDLKLEFALFQNILSAKFLNFNSEQQITAQLQQARFVNIEFNYNKRGVLPIAIAYKEQLC